MQQGGLPRQAGPTLAAPKTFGAVVRQARDALRRYRQDTAEARQAAQQQQQLEAAAGPGPGQQQLQLPRAARLTLQLPLPVASSAPPGVPLLDQPFTLLDEGDWPGGLVQRFRALRPLVEAVLEGYAPQFVGMLESPADGLGCWSAGGGGGGQAASGGQAVGGGGQGGGGGDTTVAAIPTNATFSSFAKLLRGGYGGRPLLPGHTVVAVNPEWTGPEDIGQFWERDLKRAAQELLGPSAGWDVLYSAGMVRTSRGKAFGLLVGSWGLGWHLWPADGEQSGGVRDEVGCALWSAGRPSGEEVAAALNAAATAAAGREPR